MPGIILAGRVVLDLEGGFIHRVLQAIAKEEGIMGSVFLFPSETMIGPWSWSKCSSQKIGELINQGLGNCMMRRTREFSVRSPTLIQPHTSLYTGRTHISPDVQCKLGEYFSRRNPSLRL